MENNKEDWEIKLESVEKEYPMALENWSTDDWKSFIRSTIKQARIQALEEAGEALSGVSWDNMKCDCNMCYAHKKALSYAQDIISQLKNK